jgi:hypothetical protein
MRLLASDYLTKSSYFNWSSRSYACSIVLGSTVISRSKRISVGTDYGVMYGREYEFKIYFYDNELSDLSDAKEMPIYRGYNRGDYIDLGYIVKSKDILKFLHKHFIVIH